MERGSLSVEIIPVAEEDRARYLPGVLAVAELEHGASTSKMITHGPEFFARYYGAGGDTCVALLAGRVVGFALLAAPERLHSIWHARASSLGLSRERCGCLVQVVLAPEARGRGISRALVAEVHARARARGLEHLFTSVDPENTASVRMVERGGFRRFEIATVYSEQVVRALFHCPVAAAADDSAIAWA